MTKPHKSHTPVHYRIKLKEHLDNKWSEWFEKMDISTEDGETILTGQWQIKQLYTDCLSEFAT